MAFRVLDDIRAGRTWPWQASAAALAVALAADYVVFRLLDVNYFRWYVENGALIQLLVGGIALVIDLESEPKLISVHPGEYLASAETVIGLTAINFAADMRPAPDPSEEERTRQRILPRRWEPDFLFGGLLHIAWVLVGVAWLIVIAPVQYVGNLVAGAPARLALANPHHLAVFRRGPVISIVPVSAGSRANAPEVIGLTKKPVAATASITAALLFGLSYLV